MGVCSGALVAWGAALRVFTGVRFGCVGDVCAMALTADGVGVNRGAAIGVVSAAGLRRRLFGGVDGTSGTLNAVSSAEAAVAARFLD